MNFSEFKDLPWKRVLLFFVFTTMLVFPQKCGYTIGFPVSTYSTASGMIESVFRILFAISFSIGLWYYCKKYVNNNSQFGVTMVIIYLFPTIIGFGVRYFTFTLSRYFVFNVVICAILFATVFMRFQKRAKNTPKFFLLVASTYFVCLFVISLFTRYGGGALIGYLLSISFFINFIFTVIFSITFLMLYRRFKDGKFRVGMWFVLIYVLPLIALSILFLTLVPISSVIFRSFNLNPDMLFDIVSTPGVYLYMPVLGIQTRLFQNLSDPIGIRLAFVLFVAVLFFAGYLLGFFLVDTEEKTRKSK